MQEALERAMAELVFGPALDPADHDGVLRWLERSGVTREDSAAILESDLTRLFVYRDLIRGTLWEAMDVSMPRVVARLGDVFEEYFDRFLLERGTRTHYLRDATPELLDFCEPLWKDDPRVPAYMMQLARHEYVQIEVGAMQAGSPDQEPAELDLEAPLAFVEAVRLMRYDWALHELPEDPNDETIPVERPTALFVYRNPEHEVRYLELTPLAAAILERALAGEALGHAITSACQTQGVALDDAVLSGTAKLLSDLAQRGALLGTRPGKDA